MDSIKITFFGIGCCIIKGKYEEETWIRFRNGAKTIKYSLEDAFFENTFYKELKEYNNWTDLGNVFNVSGLLNNYQSVIEIKINNKKKAKILFQELLNDEFLFPLYQTIISEENEKGNLTIVEKEIGTIATYKLETDNFSLDKLQFTLKVVRVTEELKYIVLTKIEYNRKELTSKKSDTLVRERFALL